MADLIKFSKHIMSGDIRFKSKAAIIRLNSVRKCLKRLAQLSHDNIRDIRKARDLVIRAIMKKNGESLIPLEVIVSICNESINKRELDW